VVAGVGVYTVGTYGLDLPYPFLSSLVASGLVYLGVSVFERGGPRIDSAEAA
jgi:hypothetical protein